MVAHITSSVTDNGLIVFFFFFSPHVFRLTVEEHIYFYARLKGCGRSEVESEIDQMIKDVGLPHKRKDLAKNLSGESAFYIDITKRV